MPPTFRIRRTLIAVGLGGVLALTSCIGPAAPGPDASQTAGQAETTVVIKKYTGPLRKVLVDSQSEASLQMSRSLFERSPVAVVFARDATIGYAGTDADIGAAVSAAAGLKVPLLVVNPDGGGLIGVRSELERLGVGTVIGYGSPAADWAVLGSSRKLLAGPSTVTGFSSVLKLTVTAAPVRPADVAASTSTLHSTALQLLKITATAPRTPGKGAETAPVTASGVERPLAEQATTDTLPYFTPAQGPASALVLDTALSTPAPLATARAAGAKVQVLTEGDPRSTSASVEAVAASARSPVFGVGSAFGTDDEFADHTAVAATGVELPGGGQTVFPGRRMVALYGHPSGPSLGALGEQGVDETIVRVKDLAAQHQPYSDEPVIPALDIIATVASGTAGPDGDYSSETPLTALKPMVDAAEKAGVYVVLDFQSGRTEFLTQVRAYEELLARPTVGLALDPEWRLAPDQFPLEQIGTVSADEINRTSAWLADLTRKRNLPQKVMMLHQFKLTMISNRKDLNLSHGEVAITLQADGHGTTHQKLETFDALQADLPAGIWPSWKNFYDEDRPMLSPAQTFSLVTPKPWLVTYQ